MATTSSLLGHARECSRSGRCSTRDGTLVIRSLGLGLGDLKEHHILNRTPRWCRDGLVFAADVRHAKEVIEEFEEASSKPLSSPVVVDSASGNHADNQRLQGDVEKQLYQRIVANDRLDFRFSISCLASAVSAPTLGVLQAAKGVGRYLRKVPVAWQGFPFCDPRPGVLLCYADAECATE